MTLKIIRGPEAEETVRDAHFQSQWLKMCEACPWSTGCQTPGFVNAWYDAYGERYSRLIVAESSAAGELTGLLTLAKEERSGKMVAAGAHQGEYKTWLALPENGNNFIEAALAELAQEPGIGTLVLKYLPPGTPMEWSTRKQNGWSCDVERIPRPIIPVGAADEFSDYLKKKKSSKSTRSKWNRLKRLGNLRLERIRDAGELASIFDELIVYNDLRQGGMHGKFEFQDDPAKKPFHLAMMRAGNLLHATVLRTDQGIVSALFGVISRGTFSFSMPMINPFYAADSPMTVHVLMLLEELHKDGYSVFDLTSSMDPFKERFAARFDSVGVLSIDFSQRDRIKRKVVRMGETLARRGLRSMRIAPNSALEHWKQAARVPVARWPSVVGQEAMSLSRKLRAGGKFKIYALNAQNVPAFERTPRMSKDNLGDLLTLRPAGVWQTRSRFAAEALKRIEAGHHFYTCVKNGRLVHISWLAENEKSKLVPGTGQAFEFPEGSAVMYGSYTDPEWRRRGLLRAAVKQMMHDAAQVPGMRQVFAAVPAEQEGVCRMIEGLGFVRVPEVVKRDAGSAEGALTRDAALGDAQRLSEPEVEQVTEHRQAES